MDSYWSDFVAGCLGGIGGTFVGHPIDTIKVRQQTNERGTLTARQCVRLAFKHEGATGLFKGMSSPLYTAAAVNACFFGVYGNVLKFLQGACKEPASAEPDYSLVMAAGAIAGTVQLVINCPVELVKIKLQTGSAGAGSPTPPLANGSLTTNLAGHKPFKGPMDCLIALNKMQGVRGLYKGLVPMFWRDGWSYGVYMGLYELILREGKKFTNWNDNFLSLIAGGITGTVTWIIVLPLDVVKSRIQSDCIRNPKYRGMLDCMKVSYQTEGWQVFSRGLYTVAVRALIVNAGTFFVYQNALKHFNQK